MDEGHVLVMGAGAQESALDLLLHKIAANGLTVVRGPDIGGHPSYAQEADAAALLVPSGAQGWPDSKQFDSTRFAKEGQLVYVNLGAVAPVPPDDGAGYFDLAGWAGDASAEFNRLIDHLRVLIATRVSDLYVWKLDTDQVHSAASGIAELQSLADKIAQIGDALSGDEERSRPLRETLDEISRTYRVVKSAVERFITAGAAPGGPEAQVFAGLAYGTLAQQIRNGRGHCHRIGRRYTRVGGLREGLATELTAKALKDIDETFDRLANADGDVFSAMDSLGYALTNESQVIVRYLLTGRSDQARQNIAGALDRLIPLESALEQALAAFQVVTSVLGYAESPPKEEKIYMSKLVFQGPVINSTVVAAQTIEKSQIAVKQSAAPQDIKDVLDALHEATKNLTSRLSQKDAALAAKDLKDLAEEAMSPTPSRPVWLRAADGLLSVAKKAGDTGVVMVDLVGKLATFLGHPLGV
ncbi:hypothetical protein [Reyranella soli]|uniref:Uncharacterized protein n=1 Tax=Reyranella soli TaxID=1230389 RepID=A0A512NQD6_9HYPH|nr:hypothetical protein [Reyranella soli]GEP61165.1 hypothetical protein RSO01_83310 [Reyranella soli]